MRVALDLEDVIVRTNEVFMDETNQFIQENHPEAETIQRPETAEWRYPVVIERLAELQGWTDNGQEKFFHGDSNGWDGYFPITERIWRVEPERYSETVENVSEKVGRIRKQVDKHGGKLALVTARENVTEGIETRLRQLGITELLDEVIVEVEKHELDFDIYVDDYPELYKKLDGARQIMVTWSWNRAEEIEDPHIRVENITKAAEVIENLG